MSFIKTLNKLFKRPEPEKVPDKKTKTKKYPKPKKKKKRPFYSEKIKKAQVKAQNIIREAKNHARNIRQEIKRKEQRIDRKEAEIDKKTGALDERKKLLREKEKELKVKFEEVEKVKKQQLEKLERAAGLTREESRELIIEAVEKKMTPQIARKIKEAEERAKEEADKKAREVLVNAMHKGATDYVAEYTVSSVKLENEDMKGRIIGKEGRNIRTFEKITGVDVDLDEEGVIRLSCFDSVRREIACVALKRLIADGRIQPSRIEDIIKETRKDIQKIMKEEGEKLCHKVKVYNLPSEVVAKLGRFKYRFSYGQNMISHTLEETKIGIALAHEIGADVNITRLGCLLHDIGKVINEGEGSHVELGVNYLKKYNIPQEVLDCVAQHHEDEPFTSTESILVYIADAISGSRPGARYENYEDYVERLEKLEKKAESFDGVKNAYAIQAGREVRVIVNPKKIDDSGIVKLAADLRDKIKEEMTYPGQVKVTVIRETRAQKTAK